MFGDGRTTTRMGTDPLVTEFRGLEASRAVSKRLAAAKLLKKQRSMERLPTSINHNRPLLMRCTLFYYVNFSRRLEYS